jgi:hypothetical protein
MPIKVKDCECVAQTPAALKIVSTEYPFGGKELWIPETAIHEDSEVYMDGHTGECVIEDWFAEKKGWI